MDDENVIKSDLNFIKKHMHDIQTKVKRTDDYCRERHAVDSVKNGNMLYSQMNKTLKTFLDAEAVLLDKLGKDTNSAIDIGVEYDNLDKELASKVGDL